MPRTLVRRWRSPGDKRLQQALQHSIHSRISEVDNPRYPRKQFRVADGNPTNGFVHITARLRRGRSAEQRKALGEALLAAADKRLASVYPTHPVAMTVEVHEIDPDMTFRRNTLRERAQSAA